MVNSALTERISAAAADHKAPIQKPFSRGHMIFLSAVLGFYFFTVGMWISPEGHFKDAVVPYMRPVTNAFGIGQSWSLFAPEVRTYNAHMTATIQFKDGSTKFYEYPRMEKMDFFGQLKREKLRKLFIDNMPGVGFVEFRPSIAREIAQANNDPNNPPEMVSLAQHWVSTPPPEQWVYRDNFPEHTTHQTLFTYKVRPEDLK
jgi:hypothetical protein